MNINLKLLLLAAAGLVAANCGGTPPEQGQARAIGAEAAPVKATTAPITRGTAATQKAPAHIRSRQHARISSRIPAIVMSVPFREGDAIRAGDVLVRLDDAPHRAAVTAAMTQLATAENEERRVTNLLAKGAATARESEGVKARLEGARAAVVSAKDLLGTTSIRAPFSGRVVSRSVNPGDLANPGAPLLELQGGSALELVASVEPSEAALLRVGQKLRVRADGVDLPFEATVHSISPAADDTTHRVDVLCNLNSDPSLKPGLFARVELPASKSGEPGPLSVPEGAVLRRGGLTGVFAVKDGRAWLRWIALGRDLGDRIEVRAGLVEGEHVVIAPAGLVDGAAVIEVLQ